MVFTQRLRQILETTDIKTVQIVFTYYDLSGPYDDILKDNLVLETPDVHIGDNFIEINKVIDDYGKISDGIQLIPSDLVRKIELDNKSTELIISLKPDFNDSYTEYLEQSDNVPGKKSIVDLLSRFIQNVDTISFVEDKEPGFWCTATDNIECEDGCLIVTLQDMEEDLDVKRTIPEQSIYQFEYDKNNMEVVIYLTDNPTTMHRERIKR